MAIAEKNASLHVSMKTGRFMLCFGMGGEKGCAETRAGPRVRGSGFVGEGGVFAAGEDTRDGGARQCQVRTGIEMIGLVADSRRVATFIFPSMALRVAVALTVDSTGAFGSSFRSSFSSRFSSGFSGSFSSSFSTSFISSFSNSFSSSFSSSFRSSFNSALAVVPAVALAVVSAVALAMVLAAVLTVALAVAFAAACWGSWIFSKLPCHTVGAACDLKLKSQIHASILEIS